MFPLSLALSFLVSVSFYMLIYILSFYTISAAGLRLMIASVVEFFSGGGIPLPFFPDRVRAVLELLPFASMQNVPLRIYSGSMTGMQMQRAVMLQFIWLIVLLAVGKALCAMAQRRVMLQGG